jgi:uncharacterized membrane protein YjdF
MAIEGAGEAYTNTRAEMVWLVDSREPFSHGAYFAIGVKQYPSQTWLIERSIYNLHGQVLSEIVWPLSKIIKKF